MWYNIDFKKLILLMLPISLRKVGLIAWLEAMIEPIRQIQYDFVQKRQETLYNLQHNGQVCFLRKILNDIFDIERRRIKIIDGNQYDRFYIYTKGEQKTKYLGVFYLHQRLDYRGTSDFIIQVPSSLQYDSYQLNAIVNYFKLAGMQYKIENYE
ncbi:hypothetical protein QNH98_04715 [Myroides sp. mNGS23_01]|nr:hypothetical protein [Myroides sp. mNGS23_01]WHT39963.1 hypothetical protein QNH98_04715 [Myroides sp. mNGS23_01]